MRPWSHVVLSYFIKRTEIQPILNFVLNFSLLFFKWRHNSIPHNPHFPSHHFQIRITQIQSSPIFSTSLPRNSSTRLHRHFILKYNFIITLQEVIYIPPRLHFDHSFFHIKKQTTKESLSLFCCSLILIDLGLLYATGMRSQSICLITNHLL